MEAKESFDTKQNSSKIIDYLINNLSIDVERISAGQNQADNIQCFLCFRVPFSPLLIVCCDQIICNGCLNKWKEKNSICPHCREADFMANIPNKFIKRIYDEIKYFCIYKEKGCNKNDLSNIQINTHEETCEFNPNRIIQCKNCNEKYLITSESEHDCVKGLFEKNKKLNEKINELQKEIKILKDPNNKKTELEGLVEEYSYLSHTLK